MDIENKSRNEKIGNKKMYGRCNSMQNGLNLKGIQIYNVQCTGSI